MKYRKLIVAASITALCGILYYMYSDTEIGHILTSFMLGAAVIQLFIESVEHI